MSAAFRCDTSAAPRPLAHVGEHVVGGGHAVAVECALPPHALAAFRLELA